MARKTLKTGNVVLCEHVAKGERNKFTLVNVFAGDVLVDEMPAKLLFGIYIEHIADSLEPQTLTVELKMDNEPFGRIEIQSRPKKLGVPGAIVLPHFEMGVDKDLTFTVEISSKGYKTSTILSKRFALNRQAATAISSSESSPPS